MPKRVPTPVFILNQLDCFALAGAEDPLILSFSPQARLGVLAIESGHIRKRIWLGEGTLL
jgi:hypothetical protein